MVWHQQYDNWIDACACQCSKSCGCRKSSGTSERKVTSLTTALVTRQLQNVFLRSLETHKIVESRNSQERTLFIIYFNGVNRELSITPLLGRPRPRMIRPLLILKPFPPPLCFTPPGNSSRRNLPLLLWLAVCKPASPHPAEALI